MDASKTWAKGDRLVHKAKPEWGTGHVERAEPATHEGRPCQRLTVRFERAGKKTISTAFASLRPAEGGPAINKAKTPAAPPPVTSGPVSMPATQPAQNQSESDHADFDPAAAREIMSKVPDEAIDPFRPVAERLRATLDLYRFETSGRSLMDWASIQSGLADPLSVFSRHDLEVHHQRFQVRVDQHLAELLKACHAERVDPRPILAQASPAARRALTRINAHR